jgi:hypothetical protein
LIDAHIIPAAFCREMRSPGETTLYLLSKNTADHTKRSPIGPYDPQILCRECEDQFEKLDDYAARLLIRDRDTAFQRQIVGEHEVYVAESVDYAQLKLFVISVLWRASASGLPFFRRIDLGPRLARARQMLEESDPGTPAEFATFFTRWIKTPGKQLPPKFMASPVSRRYEGARGAKLYLGYFVANVCTSSASFPSPLSDFAIAPDKPVVAIGIPLSGSGDVETFRSSLLKRGARRPRRTP